MSMLPFSIHKSIIHKFRDMHPKAQGYGVLILDNRQYALTLEGLSDARLLSAATDNPDYRLAVECLLRGPEDPAWYLDLLYVQSLCAIVTWV